MNLNRRKEAWDLLIEETEDLIKKYGVDGFHLDDIQSWPPMFEVDIEELERKEFDGENIYNIEDIFYGKIVLQRSFTGYWATE